VSSPGGDPQKPSATRIVIWVGVTAVAVYFVVSGVIGLLGG
jgi:hypothetical protein